MNTQEPIQPELVRSNSTASSVKSGKLSHHDASVEAQQAEVEHKKVRPPLDYSSFGNFWASVGARTRSIFTRRFVLALLGGQLVSICITCTSVSTTELVNRGWSLPTTQTFFLYFALFVLYTPYTIYQYGFKGWGNVVIKDGWKYFILAACDVEANFLVVNAYKYTNLLSCMLLNS
ncbi:putative solute carrier family 35 member C320,08 [Rhizoctonia solani AG-1 IB]|nr:putative solute carrier family 35 member C320,08 [Rhizoctonia solani AG-1 IB]